MRERDRRRRRRYLKLYENEFAVLIIRVGAHHNAFNACGRKKSSHQNKPPTKKRDKQKKNVRKKAWKSIKERRK